MKIIIAYILLSLFTTYSYSSSFNAESDLLIMQFDSKTDVDDLHTIAATHSILNKLKTSNIKYIAVAGTYGIQKGLYVPSPELFISAFKDNWLDAHRSYEDTLFLVADRIKKHITKGGNIWVMEAGQSNFTAQWLKQVSKQLPNVVLKEVINVVQHSKWNEDQTSNASLKTTKEIARYYKIPDGNKTGNGSAGFNNMNSNAVKSLVKNPFYGRSWRLALELANKYNGLNGRYLNKVIDQGGLDFSDASELIWILGIDNVSDIDSFIHWLK